MVAVLTWFLHPLSVIVADMGSFVGQEGVGPISVESTVDMIVSTGLFTFNLSSLSQKNQFMRS